MTRGALLGLLALANDDRRTGFFFAVGAEPLAIRHSIEGRVEACDVIRVVALHPADVSLGRGGNAKARTFSHTSSEGSSPVSWLHTTQSSGASISNGCRGRSESLSLGFAMKNVVF